MQLDKDKHQYECSSIQSLKGYGTAAAAADTTTTTFDVCLTRLFFADHSGLARVPRRFPNKKLCRLLVQYFVQNECTSCHPTSTIRALNGQVYRYLEHVRKCLVLITSCVGSRAICPRPWTPQPAAQLQPIHTLPLQRPARLVPWIFMIDRQRLTLGGSVEYGVVYVNYVVTWTANQSSLVTLTFDLSTLKVVSESV